MHALQKYLAQLDPTLLYGNSDSNFYRSYPESYTYTCPSSDLHRANSISTKADDTNDRRQHV